MLWTGNESQCPGLQCPRRIGGSRKHGNQVSSPSLRSGAPPNQRMATQHSQDHSKIQAKKPVGESCSYQGVCVGCWGTAGRGRFSLNQGPYLTKE